MSSGQQHQPPSGPSQAATMNAVGFVVRTWATSVEVLLHKRVGERYLGLQAAAVLLLIPCYCLFWRGYDLQPLMCFFVVYLCGVGVARADVLSRKRSGMPIHSFYTGYPRLRRARCKLSEVKFKKLFEPLITAGFGFGLYLLGEEPLGMYILIAGVCMFLSVAMSEMQFETRAAALRDQVIEQQYVAERFREMQGYGF